jgi:hypothetical protein
MYSKEEAYSQISALVERFSEQLPSYKKSDYNETDMKLCQSFLKILNEGNEIN